MLFRSGPLLVATDRSATQPEVAGGARRSDPDQRNAGPAMNNWVERSVGRFRTGVEEETRHRCPMSALSPRRRRRSGGGSRQMAPDGVPPRSRMSHTHFTASVLSYELRSLLDVSAIVCAIVINACTDLFRQISVTNRVAEQACEPS